MITCPKCGKSYFQYLYSTTTLMYCPTIIKDGKVISYDTNKSTDYLKCLECGEEFTSSSGLLRVEDSNNAIPL